MKSLNGFTLIEALIVMTIIAVFASMGVPSLQNFVQKQKLESARQDILALAQLARGTAVSEGSATVICGSQDGQQCTGGTLWQDYVIAFHDTDANHRRNEDESLIFSQALGNANIRGTRGLLEFNASGAGYMGSWLYCSPDARALAQTFRLVVSLGGRIRIEPTDPQRCS